MRLNRKVLACLATAGVAAGTVMAAVPSANAAAGPDLLPMTITNNSGRSEAVHLYVTGEIDGKLGYVNAAGAFTRWTGGAKVPVPAPDVSIPGPGNGGSTTIQVPRGISGRVYMAFGDKLDFKLTEDGLVQPAPWAAGDPSRDKLFDWSEFTYNDAGLWLNSSQVDMFAVPHAVSVTGTDGRTVKTGELKPNGRNAVINAMKRNSTFDDLVQTRQDGTVVRVLAPGKGADAGAFDPNYLDPYINKAWGSYTNQTLTVVPFKEQPNTKFFGRTAGDVMTFTDGSGKQVASFRKPSTADVWGCDGNIAAPNDLVVGPIARSLCAALHRSTLGSLPVEPSTDPATFYRGDLTNHYSKVIHENMVDGRAYGFAFDDVAAQESLVHSGAPTKAGITLTAF